MSTLSTLVTTDDGIELRGLRRDEYQRLVEAGAFTDERIELIGGEIVRMSPQSEQHAWVVMRLTAQLATLMLRGFELRVQLPLAVDDGSLPEPDIAVTDPLPALSGHPTGAHAVIEVAVTSQRMDLFHKPSLYAAAGIPLYIALDVPTKRAFVHRDPDAGGYQTVDMLNPGDDLNVLDARLDLAELFG